MKKLIEVLSIQTTTYNDKQMVRFLQRKIKQMGLHWKMDKGNLYVTKGKADRYPCVVAHMDTVHEIESDFKVLNLGGKLFAMNPETMSQVGIGGDDKVGIYIALQCLEYFPNIKVAFFRDEETGCEGSYKADVGFFNDVSFILQADRKGNSDFITNASGIDLSSVDFQYDIEPIIQSYGYEFEYGMMTDVMALREIGVSCSMANVSCGYYNPHCPDEYVVVEEVEHTLEMFKEIIGKLEGNYDFAYEPVRWQNTYKLQPKGNVCTDCMWGRPVKDGLCQDCIDYYESQLKYTVI